ncbi:MAG: VWA domain-containing protein, partial [Vicinamibacterales bacterium]
MKTMRELSPVLGAALLIVLTCPGYSSAQGRERMVVVTALEKRTGRPAESLAASDVMIREDGVAREVLRVVRMEEPMQLAILVDNSQAADPHVSQLRAALAEFLGDLAPRHTVSLVTYAERPTLAVSFSADRKPVLDATQRLFSISGSGAYLLDAIAETAEGFLKRQATRPVIVAVDVGGRPFSHAASRRVLDRLTAAGAQLHVVQVIRIGLEDHSQEEREQSIVIDEGTRKTGGRRMDLVTSMALP